MRLVAEKFRGMQYDGTYYFFKEPERIKDTAPEKKPLPSGSIDKLYGAFLTVLEKTQRRAPPPKRNFDGIVGREPASVKDKARGLVTRLKRDKKVKFENIFSDASSKNEVVAIFLAVLELLKLNRITVYDADESVMIELDGDASADEIAAELDGSDFDDKTTGDQENEHRRT